MTTIAWDDPNYLHVGGDVDLETPKAICLILRRNGRRLWIPKSILRLAVSSLYGEEFAVPMWFASRERLRY